ncbi:PapD-like [Plasmopara halstedii]|uniref:PapD-like n=1 Tax=Plasmopara halstedii TaxID=4781 RepID=A0A0N7L4P6_PLAHL|nr:PapD-like [Plasmopara halstedii]CEG39259.1 PapD-like [Plasmopara halstedii]|eukprot:XP_024575628.1 PapD-like [Plasmopara halstedii]
MAKFRALEVAPAPVLGEMDITMGNQTTASDRKTTRAPQSPSSALAVAMLRKAERSRVEYCGGKGELLGLGDIYLNDLSDIIVFEITNLTTRNLKVRLRAELRKPFQNSQWCFQLENENVSVMQRELQQEKDRTVTSDKFNHVPFSVLPSSSKANLLADNVYLCEGYNELFNHIGAIDEIILGPRESKKIIFALCTKLTPQHSITGNSAFVAAGDSSEEERAHLSETSCFVLSGRLILQPLFVDADATKEAPMSEMLVPLQAQVCRSLLRLDVQELHFDDCVPGGSFVKDFAVWNRSEIPLLFNLVSPLSPWSENNEVLLCTDYNSGYIIGDKTLQAAAYGHVRIRVTYRPKDIGEHFFEIQAQNLHDSRNVKTLKIHAVTNWEHHREGLSIKEPDGSHLMSGSQLDFGDCFTGIANSKVIMLRNMTEVALHVKLNSDRPKEVTFELKLQQNRSRVPRSPRAIKLLSPSYSNDRSSVKGLSSPCVDAYGLDSDEEVDEEVDDNDDNEGEFYEEAIQQAKITSFGETAVGDGDDFDDDFEFDRESRALLERPSVSPKLRVSRATTDLRKKSTRSHGKKSSKTLSRLRELVYDSGVDSPRSSPERSFQADQHKRHSVSPDDNSVSNFLVESIDLPPGVERTIVIWYSPAVSSNNLENIYCGSSDVDPKVARLTKQNFRISFRCFVMQGAWQQTQSREFDRSLGKSIYICARTCTSIVTATPSILHLGDCNIGELKSSSCILTNHSELPTVVKPLVTSKVISTVPNDDMMLGPKQSTELKIEIIPRKTNPNYSRVISVINLRNKSNISQICVRSSNMDAHHVIYHSLFYKLLTQSRSAFLNFEHVTTNSVGVQVFDLENITNAPLPLNIKVSSPSKVQLYCIRNSFDKASNTIERLSSDENHVKESKQSFSPSSVSSTSQNSLGGDIFKNTSNQRGQPPIRRPIRRRRSFCSVSELEDGKARYRKAKLTALRDIMSKKRSVAQTGVLSTANISGATNILRSASTNHFDNGRNCQDQQNAEALEFKESHVQALSDLRRSPNGSCIGSLPAPLASHADKRSSEDIASLLQLFAKSRFECDEYCHGSVFSKEKEEEIVAMVRDRVKRLESLLAEKKMIPLSSHKERNLRIPAKSRQRIVAVFRPVATELTNPDDVSKTRVEKHKIFITLPPGGNNKAHIVGENFDQSRPAWAASRHPFDSRPSVRELLVKSRVCSSIMNVNQKNINFGRIATSSKSSKRLSVQNMSTTPLVYSVEKTGSISSGFLQIKEGEFGVVKAFGTKEICFQFQPTLAGPFEEKLKIINVQDPDNSVSVTIKAKVVKRETFKILQSGQTISFEKCLVGKKTDEVKIAVRNTSLKKREYVIQLDPASTYPTLRPTFYFSIDDTPAAVVTQAQEKKLDEELEKLEHKLRIAITKKKADKIVRLNAKISQVKALLSGELLSKELGTPTDRYLDATGKPGATSWVGEYDSYESGNSDSEMSESECIVHLRRRRFKQSDKPVIEAKCAQGSVGTNCLRFSLEAEATGRIVTYAVFNPVRSDDISPHGADDKSGGHRSQRMKQRLLCRNVTSIEGTGKFLFFEQQNKDVVKELHYKAEIFLRTFAGEDAFCRAIGQRPPSVLPPHPQTGVVPPDCSLDVCRVKTNCTSRMSRYEDVLPSLIAPTGIESEKVERRRKLTITIPDSRKKKRVLNIDIVPDQPGISPTSSSLLVPAEESPIDAREWILALSLGSMSYKRPEVVKMSWNPASTFENVLALTCEVLPRDCLISDNIEETSDRTDSTNLKKMLPLTLNIPLDRTVNLKLKWCYASEAGFAPSTPLASCVNRSVLDCVSKAAELNAGRIEFFHNPGNTSPINGIDAMTSTLVTSVDVAVVRRYQGSLYFELETIDLGEHQQGENVRSEITVFNRSHQALQFLLLAGTREHGNGSASSSGAPLLVGGEIMFENATGTVEAESFVKAAFVYKAHVPGQHTEQIVLRNLSGGRLDMSVLEVLVRVTRPVYVRVPELDPQLTGQLGVLDLGPCYVTPEMQDTAADHPNISLRFSKVHKLTLQSQVDHTLVIYASSNLKTQCYVYEDARLHCEATNVIMKGNQAIDLYVAIRPRLSPDAFKTGLTRDLVGGIRIQLFGLQMSPESSEDEKTEMLAEFTVKFVGVAGASVARVTPSLIDFGVEHSNGHLQSMQAHEGCFEVVNMSKALPFRYRLSVTRATDGYSDNDHNFHVLLKHEKGEIPPGETGNVEFCVLAKINGLFRRRIVVESIHYPGRVNFIDVALFVDNGTLRCEIPAVVRANQDRDISKFDAAQEPFTLHTIDVGPISVIPLEDEFTTNFVTCAGGNEPTRRKYRIFGEHGTKALLGVWDKDASNSMSLPAIQSDGKLLALTNTTVQSILVRPFSTLPLIFEWDGNMDKIFSTMSHSAAGFSTSNAITNTISFVSPHSQPCLYGNSYLLQARGSCTLSCRFADIAVSVPLPSDPIDSGKLFPFRGMIGIQSVQSRNTLEEKASTLKVVNVLGAYCEPRFQISEKCHFLGKIGYGIGWKASTFQVCLNNVSDVELFFIIANIPPCIQVSCTQGGRRVHFLDDDAYASAFHVPSLQILTLHAYKPTQSDGSPPWGAWRVQPRASCVLEMELVRTKVVLAAGMQEFSLRFLNVCNPHNREVVVVRAHIISSYAELAIDPESINSEIEMTNPNENHVALLPPVTVPPPQESPPHCSSFWFTLRNVYDEDLSVKLFSKTHSIFNRILDLLLMLRSANTPLTSITIAPGESVDIRVVCLVLPSARLSADIWSARESESTARILDLGLVYIHVNIHNLDDSAQREEIYVKGKLLPGKTFVLSASSLNFFATATDILSDTPIEQISPPIQSNLGVSKNSSPVMPPGMPQQLGYSVVHQLRNSFESFWVKNLSTVGELNFVINPASMYQPKLCLVKGSTESDVCAMSEWIQAIAVPSSGTIAPGESVKVTVHLEEAFESAQALSSCEIPHRKLGDHTLAGKAIALHKMHHPSWRSNSWDADEIETSTEKNGMSHMFLTVRDADLKLEAEVSTGVNIMLILQQQSSASDPSKQGSFVLDKALMSAAFDARNKRLAHFWRPHSKPAIETHPNDEVYEQVRSPGLDKLEKFDISLIRSGPVGHKNQLPVLAVRGCTPAEYSSLDNTRYLIDVGQHTVRNGGEIEWEITIESLYSAANAAEVAGLDSVEYRLMLVDKNARSWLQLSRERGTLDRAHSYQSVVLHFLRGVVGVYSTFMVLQNRANPHDLKVINVRLEIIADLNSLRGMSSGSDLATNLFRVLVPNHSSPKRSRRYSINMPSEIITGGAPRLLIDFSEVYYNKLYQNHSIVIENSSSLSLDFILSSNARPQEVGFSVSPMSFYEVTTITLESHASMQVFLYFRPQPKQTTLLSETSDVLSDDQLIEPWVREIEVYVSCRLVKDFRETVIIRAICSQPQLMVNVSNGDKHDPPLQLKRCYSVQPNSLGLVFSMLESNLSSPEMSITAADESYKCIVVRNTKKDMYARIALRNDSLFFTVAIDEVLTQPGAATVDLHDHGMCAGRKSTLIVTIQPQGVGVFRVQPDVAALRKHHQLWDHSVKEHVTLYNINQFAEHYQVTLCFTCSNVASFYIPPNISENFPVSALEDIIAKFLQNYEYTWKWLISYHENTLISETHSADQQLPALNLTQVLNNLELALDLVSPLSPQNLTHAAVQSFDEADGIPISRDDLYQLVLSYRALYFDFYYITDELVWYGVRGNSVRHSLALADLAYGVVFGHEVFQSFLNDPKDHKAVAFPRLLLPWIRQLGHFLSFYPENQEATQPLRQLYDHLRKFETN